jgi:cyclopropane fatty-acyl-phospholipid synthase-like methyltransferase
MRRQPAITRLRDLLEDDPLDVSREIAPDDAMHDYAPDLYFRAGIEAVRNVRLALVAAGTQSVENVLDFACGWGRVMRTLRAAFPDAQLTACDIQPAQVDFCVEAFGAKGVYSDVDPAKVRFDDRFDVIWSGSLMTHVDEGRWPGFLRVWETHLADQGVLVFTTYGRFTAQEMRLRNNLLNLTEDQAEEVLREYDSTGFGFSHSSVDADTLTDRAWVCRALDQVPTLELLLYIERGWLGQDVVACTTRGVVDFWRT